MFGKKEIELEFTKPFTSPVYGNVYEGRKVTVDEKTAAKYINSGVAKLAGEVDPKVKVPHVKVFGGKDGGKPDAVVDPYAGMTAAQKKKAIKEAADKEQEEKDALIAAKQERLDALANQDGELSAAEVMEAEALEAEIEKLKA